jgi:hypothetical protein
MDEKSNKESILKLKKFAIQARDWEEKLTSEDGINFIKIPINNRSNNQTILQIKIRKDPNSREKGVLIKNKKELFLIRDLLNNDEIQRLFEEIINNIELHDLISNSDDWTTIDSGVIGLSFVKIPNQEIPSLSLNPLNENGRKMRRRDIYLRNLDDLAKYRERFNNNRLENAVGIVEEINRDWKYHLDIGTEKGKDRFLTNTVDLIDNDYN